MTEIRFYHLSSKTLEQALPELLTKALSAGHKIIVRAADNRQVENLNELLWTYQPDSFLPHGGAKDGFAARQPVWLTAGDDNPNGANVLVLAGGAGDPSGYTLCCDMFDGQDEQALAAARARWQACKESGHDVTYWQQGDQGGWEKKA
jgi:DNA polymerase-3 subunit chi